MNGESILANESETAFFYVEKGCLKMNSSSLTTGPEESQGTPLNRVLTQGSW
jgi:hypothetical protein